ncbi:MAG: cobalamin-independent methionine synthase II family protein [Stellaceae bacterium]
MQLSTDKILTTHTGSLPRPPALLDLLKMKDDKAAVDAAAFEAATVDATSQVVRQQIDGGIDIVNDGEMGKISYATYVKDRLTGFDAEGEFVPMSDLFDFPEFAQRFIAQSEGVRTLKTPACGSAVAWKDFAALQKDISRFKAALAGTEPRDTFMTAASPGVIALFLENKFYPSHEKYLDVLSGVMKEEYEAIHRAGFILQLDCPDLAVGRHTRFAHSSTADFIKTVELHVAAINRAVANIPADRIRLHLCWGNYEGPHHHDVPLADIIAPVLKANVGAVSIEASNPRHEHEWAVFEEVKLPPGKALIPGVIDSSTNFIEHPDLVAQRIVRFAKVVGRENVIAGTDCGFATFAAFTPVDPAIAWAKLRSLAEGARIASAQLWGK